MKKAISFLLALTMVLCLFSCGKEPVISDISETVSNSEKEITESITELITNIITPSLASTTLPETKPIPTLRCLNSEEYAPPLAYCTADFGLRLFKEVMTEQKNPLISPLSVVAALTMTGLGANGETLEQITDILKIEPEELALYLRSFMSNAEMSDGITLANSVWLNGTRFVPENSFVADCRNHLDAEVFSEPFDKLTAGKINNWISKKTDGEIRSILDEAPENAMAYLVNTLLFEAEWVNPYTSFNSVSKLYFTTEDGREQFVSVLGSNHSSSRIFRLGKTTGIFSKYKNGYSFVALLPDEGISVKEAANSFTAKEFISTVSAKTSRSNFEHTGTIYSVRLPMFDFECSFELKDALARMGMADAFCEKADFSKMGSSPEGYIFLSRALHKTHIALTEKGTKAGAATVMEFKAGSARIDEIITLHFNRPFLYAIVENESAMPIFFGAVTDFE